MIISFIENAEVAHYLTKIYPMKLAASQQISLYRLGHISCLPVVPLK